MRKSVTNAVVKPLCGQFNNERIHTVESLSFLLSQNELHDQFSLSEHRLPINHNHKSATQQHVSFRAVVTQTLGLMVIVATEVTRLNKEHHNVGGLSPVLL